MPAYSQAYARAFLRALNVERRNAGDFTIEQLLETAMVGRVNATKLGTLVTSTAQNGKSVSFAIPPGLSSVVLSELCVDLLALYSRASSYLIQQGTASPTEEEIWTEMNELLMCEDAPADFSELREFALAI